MQYSKEVVARARTLLAGQEADRQSRNAARLEEAYIRLPQLKAIDIQLRATMSEAALAAFSQGGDVAAAMEQVKQKNLALQEQRKALIAQAFGPDWQEEEPACSHCGGSGYVGSTMCACLKEICIREHRKELGALFGGSESFETFRLDYYSNTVIPKLGVSPRELMEDNLDGCIRYARSFSKGAGNLMLAGGTGLGKTHLAIAIGKAVGEQGYTVCYETAISLFSKLEKAKFLPSEDTLKAAERLENCDLLIIDDLGTEMPGQFVTAALYGLLNQRLMAAKPMVLTTNLNVDEASQRYSPQIASRLYGDFIRLQFVGTDIRVMKYKGV